MTTQPQDENKLIVERRQKLAAIRARGVAFPNHAPPTRPPRCTPPMTASKMPASSPPPAKSPSPGG